MAPLTWRNVDAPNLGPAARIMESAARMWENAGDGVGDAFRGFGETRRRDASNNMLAELSKVKTESQVDPALAAAAGMQGRNMSSELIQAMFGLRKDAMGYDTTRLQQNGIRARNAATRAASARAASAAARAAAKEQELAGIMPELIRGRQESLAADGQFPGASGYGVSAVPSPAPAGINFSTKDLSFGVPSDAPVGTPAPVANIPEPQESLQFTQGRAPVDVAKLAEGLEYDHTSALLTYLDNNYEKFNTARQNSDDNRGRDFDFRNDFVDREREDAAFERGERARKARQRAADYVSENWREILIDPDAHIRKIQGDPSIPAGDKDARIQRIRSTVAENPELLQTSTSVSLPPTMRADAAAGDAATEFDRLNNLDARTIDNALSRSASSGSGDGGSDGEGGGGNVPTTVEEFVSQHGRDGSFWRTTTRDDIRNTLHEIGIETGLPEEVIVREAQMSLRSGFGDDGAPTLDKGVLLERLNVLSDRDAFIATRDKQMAMAVNRATMTQAESSYAQISQQRQRLIEAGVPENAPQIRSMNAQLEELKRQHAAAEDKLKEDVFGSRGAAATAEAEADAGFMSRIDAMLSGISEQAQTVAAEERQANDPSVVSRGLKRVSDTLRGTVSKQLEGYANFLEQNAKTDTTFIDNFRDPAEVQTRLAQGRRDMMVADWLRKPEVKLKASVEPAFRDALKRNPHQAYLDYADVIVIE